MISYRGIRQDGSSKIYTPSKQSSYMVNNKALIMF